MSLKNRSFLKLLDYTQNSQKKKKQLCVKDRRQKMGKKVPFSRKASE